MPVNAEDLPALDTDEENKIVGLDTANQGALYDGKALVRQRIKGLVSLSADQTLELLHEGKLLDMDSGSARTITVPTNASVAFPIGSRIRVLRSGTGTVTIAAAGGVTLLTAGRSKLRAQGSVGELIKVGTDRWAFTGDTAA